MINNNIKSPYSDQFSIGMRNKLGDWNTSATLARIIQYNGIVGQLGNRYPNGAFYTYGTFTNQWGNAGVPGYRQPDLCSTTARPPTTPSCCCRPRSPTPGERLGHDDRLHPHPRHAEPPVLRRLRVRPAEHQGLPVPALQRGAQASPGRDRLGRRARGVSRCRQAGAGDADAGQCASPAATCSRTRSARRARLGGVAGGGHSERFEVPVRRPDLRLPRRRLAGIEELRSRPAVSRCRCASMR